MSSGFAPRRLLLAVACAGIVATGCAPTMRLHGYVPSAEDIATLRPGIDTYESVEAALGRPSSSGLLQERAWYYVQSTVRHYTYNKPQVVDRTVLAVNFSESGVVTEIARYGLEDGRIINLTTRTTETGGRRLGVLEQLFGNLLNLDASQFER